MLSLDDSLKVVKKYKKKLHQIARLETLDRKLSVEELSKVNSKNDIRQKLNEITAIVNTKDESFNSVSSSEVTITLGSDEHTEQNQETNYLNISATVEGSSQDTSPPPAKKLLTSVDASGDASKITTSPPEASSTTEKDNDHISLLKLKKAWKKKTFEVTELTGHNGIVCALDICGNWLVSGSHDTSVKLWDLSNAEELRNLSGHTGAVTCVKMANKSDSIKLYKSISLDSNEVSHLSQKSLKSERILLTGSVDCSIKIWLIPQGIQLKSIYNYSPVSTILHLRSVVFAGSDSGKLTAYHVPTSRQICDKNIHSEKISSLECLENLMLSSSFDGDVKLWEITKLDALSNFDQIDDDIVPTLKFSLKNDLGYAPERPILSACFYKQKIIFGDDGYNLKMIDVSEGSIFKYPNHAEGSGFTDSLLVFNELLLSTSYNPADGLGSLHVRILEENSSLLYVSSLCHPKLSRFLCCAVDKPSQFHYLVTGGEKVLLWKRKSASTEGKDQNKEKILIKAKYIMNLSEADVSSDLDSEDTETDEKSSWWWGSKTSEKTMKRRRSSSGVSTDSDFSHDSTRTKKDSNTWWCSLV